MELFNRFYSLTIGDVGVNSLEVKDLQVTFKIVKKSEKGSNSSLELDVYNLSKTSRDLLKEDSLLILKVGYNSLDNLVVVFTGQIKEISTRNVGEDVITSMTAVEGFKSTRESKLNRKFTGPVSVRTILKDIFTKDMGLPEPQFSNGTLGDSKGINKIYSKSNSKYGLAYHVVNEVCSDNDLTWNIRDGVPYVFPTNSTPKDIVKVRDINAQTGMIGSPERILTNSNKLSKSKFNKEGYKVRVFLDPLMNIGNKIYLTSSNLDSKRTLFQIDKVTHTANYRGSEWFTDIEITPPEVINE